MHAALHKHCLSITLTASLILFTGGCAQQEFNTNGQPGLKPVTLQATAATPLLNEAEAAIHAGNYTQAEILLERALRIEPENSDLWHGMARVKFGKGDFQQAVQFCLKSVSLGRDNRPLEIANYRLMEQAYLNLGDLDGARAVQKKRQQLSSW